jgi:asparagine synthase (glutamine-hydrolysing)
VRRFGKVVHERFQKRMISLDRELVEKRSRINLQDRLWDDLTTSTLPGLLRYEDRISMAFSLESRVPFLDYRLVEFALRLPSSLKVHEGWPKHILREAMKGILPDEVRLRRDKLGFPTPQRSWLRERVDWARDTLLQPELRIGSFIDARRIVPELPKILSEPFGAIELWRWLNLELWMRSFDVSASDA